VKRLQSSHDSCEKETKMKNQIKKKNQVMILNVIMETTPILTMSGIKRTTMILTIIGNVDNSGTRELNNQDGKKNEEEIARYVCSRFWNGTKFMNVYGVCLVKLVVEVADKYKMT